MRYWLALLLLGSCVPPAGDGAAPSPTSSGGWPSPLPAVSGLASGRTAPSLPAPSSTATSPATAAPAASSASSAAAACGPPASPREPLRHHRSKLAMAAGSPHHSALDAVVLAGDAFELAGKLSYGTLRKDLEDEVVVGWLRRGSSCDDWVSFARGLSDGDGRVALTSAATTVTAPGRYPFVLEVPGDGSRVRGELWLLSAGTRVVVFDIDGTLTQGDEDLLDQLLTGADPEPRPGAVEVVRAHRDHGIQPIYLTGRPYLLAELTRGWLERRGFPAGPLLTPARLTQARPGQRVERYKREVLVDLKERAKATIVRAYGNAASDLCAYAEAGVAPASTFLVGPQGGQACPGHPPSQPLSSYPEHLAGLRFAD